MKSTLSYLCAALVIVAVPGWAAPPNDIDAFVTSAMQRFEVPGMAVAIVEDGKATLTGGYGVRKLGRPQRVDEHTVFEIGSCSKAFVTAALAVLVDEGKLRWDDKVIDRLPGFRMYDGHTSLEMTVRDLLVHNSGLSLGAGDLLFYPPTDFNREDVVQRLRYLKPARSFRAGYAYDNVLYIAAERLVEQVSGLSWERFVNERMFAPLGMSDSVASSYELQGENFAWPHARIDGAMRGVGSVEALSIGEEFGKPGKSPLTGTIMSSAQDLSRWLQVQSNAGAIVANSKRLYSAESARELWTPRTLMPITDAPAAIADTTPSFQAYALGWIVRDYRGHKIVTHGGSTDGFLTSIVLIPHLRVAFAITMNSEDGEARMATYYRLLDHYLGLPVRDWIGAFAQARQQRIDAALAELRKPTHEVRGSGPSLPLASYAGRYQDAWYGSITINSAPAASTGLTISFDRSFGMSGTLEHLRHDTFRTHWADRGIEDAYVTFTLSADGSIEQMTMQAISPLADFSFDYQDLLFRPLPAQ
jgi:CubicO group peptidase (beta-lactamase class C family)